MRKQKAQGGQVICRDHTSSEWQRWDSNPEILAPQSMLLTSVLAPSTASLLTLGKNLSSWWPARPAMTFPHHLNDLTFHTFLAVSQWPPRRSSLTPGFLPGWLGTFTLAGPSSRDMSPPSVASLTPSPPAGLSSNVTFSVLMSLIPPIEHLTNISGHYPKHLTCFTSLNSLSSSGLLEPLPPPCRWEERHRCRIPREKRWSQGSSLDSVTPVSVILHTHTHTI